MKSKALAWIGIAVLIIVAVVVIISVEKGKAPVVNPGVSTPKELISVDPNMVSVAEDSYLLGIGGSYPQFPQADAVFNAKIAKIFTDEIVQFKQTVNENYKARLETEGDVFQKQFEQSGMYFYEIKSDIIQSNDQYISAVLHFGGYSGGAHPYENVITFNYDVKNKKELKVSDFLSLQSASEKSRLLLRAKFEKDGNYDENINRMMEEGTDPKNQDNFQSFTFTPDMITLYFGQYQVAPYVYGEQKIEIERVPS
jgi:hypothetical protein